MVRLLNLCAFGGKSAVKAGIREKPRVHTKKEGGFPVVYFTSNHNMSIDN